LKRENARYEAGFRLSDGYGQTVFKSNPDYTNFGWLLKGGIIFYPEENISFGIEHVRFITAINKEKQIEKNFYRSWGVKLIYSFNLK